MIWLDLTRTPEAVDSVDNSEKQRVAHTAHSPTTTLVGWPISQKGADELGNIIF